MEGGGSFLLKCLESNVPIQTREKGRRIKIIFQTEFSFFFFFFFQTEFSIKGNNTWKSPSCCSEIQVRFSSKKCILHFVLKKNNGHKLFPQCPEFLGGNEPSFKGVH